MHMICNTAVPLLPHIIGYTFVHDHVHVHDMYMVMYKCNVYHSVAVVDEWLKDLLSRKDASEPEGPCVVAT